VAIRRRPSTPAGLLEALCNPIPGLLLLLLFCLPAAGQPPSQPERPVDLTELSIEELLKVEVTSVSRRAEPISAAAAAVFVITQDDIRRSGATSIPEALRMVPGLEVARIDANKWAISARGFNGRFANKLLVLVDGRSVYTPLFSGVFWDVQDLLLEDVERIEVIRGPGATLWGANAVNGVINVLTRSARETAGGLVAASSGSEERGLLGLRYGGLLGESSAYRVYAKRFDRGSGERAAGGAGADDWSMSRAGFRLDSTLSGGGLTLQGDLYDGDVGETLTLQSLQSLLPRTLDTDMRVGGGHVLGRWQRTTAASSELVLQLFYDRTERAAALVDEDRDTFDLELQHGFAPAARHRVVWGLGYRRTGDDILGTEALSFQTARRTDELASAFLQDEVMLHPDRLWLILGSKLEHNDYSGFELQPNLRMVWIPRQRHTLWAAVSRAVRTPSRAEHDFRLSSQVIGPGGLSPGSPPAVVTILGNPDFGSEELVAWELGYRAGLAPGLFLDVATFYNDYDRLRAPRTGTPFLVAAPAPPHLVVPIHLTNALNGSTYGAELAVDWRAAERWRLSAAYSYLRIQLHAPPGTDPASVIAEGESPSHQLYLRSSLDLPRGLELDLMARYVDELPAPAVDSYTSLDLRLGWRPLRRLELSLVGQNLLEETHVEFAPEVIPTLPTGVERGVYGKLAWRF
jgi:iron complex outermembrane recepter protein